MIRCALVSAYMGPYPANYMHLDLALYERMKATGNDIIIILPTTVEHMPWVSMFVDRGIDVLFVKYNPFSLNNILEFKKILKKYNINLIYTQFCGWEYTVKFSAPNIPVIWHELMNVNNKGIPGLRSWIKYNIIGRFKTTSIATSDSNYEIISRITGGKRVVCIHDGISFGRYHTLYDRDSVTRPYKLMLFSHNPILKGLDIAYDACAILNADKMKAELYVVSLGSTGNFIKKHYPVLPKWFHILPPTSNLQAYYENADAYLCASRGEGFNNSILEALYCGCSIIFSNIPTTRQVREYKHVFEFESESASSLADAIEDAMLKSISNEEIDFNKSIIESHYSVGEWLNQVTDLMKNISNQ